jgi:hypothetical protein
VNAEKTVKRSQLLLLKGTAPASMIVAFAHEHRNKKVNRKENSFLFPL